MSTEKNIAKHLLDIKAVFLKPNDPFTWASGIKAPIYCDNRLTLSYPEVRDDVEHAIAEIIKTNASGTPRQSWAPAPPASRMLRWSLRF